MTPGQNIIRVKILSDTGNSMNLISGIIRLPSGWSFSASETDNRFYLTVAAFANSAAPAEAALNEPSLLDLHCLPLSF